MSRLFNQKLLPIFVLAFLCLNAGGVLCLTFCAQAREGSEAMSIAGMPHHCQHSTAGKSESGPNLTASARAARCCSLPVSLFAAPIEKKLAAPAVLKAEAEIVKPTVLQPVASRDISTEYVYRPPVFNKGDTRIRNCVIRI